LRCASGVPLNGEGLSTGYPQVWRSFKEATLRGSEKATHADCVVFGGELQWAQ